MFTLGEVVEILTMTGDLDSTTGLRTLVLRIMDWRDENTLVNLSQLHYICLVVELTKWAQVDAVKTAITLDTVVSIVRGIENEPISAHGYVGPAVAPAPMVAPHVATNTGGSMTMTYSLGLTNMNKRYGAVGQGMAVVNYNVLMALVKDLIVKWVVTIKTREKGGDT